MLGFIGKSEAPGGTRAICFSGYTLHVGQVTVFRFRPGFRAFKCIVNSDVNNSE